MPDSFDCFSTAMPVLISRMETAAPGMTAPVESVTVPVITP